MTEPAFAKIRSRLQDVRDTTTGFTARCPVHNGDLRVEQVDDAVLIECEAGCKPEAVLCAIGLTTLGMANKAGPADENALNYLWASTIESKSVDWYWEPRIPRAYVTDLSGDPGIGKSYLTLALAAATSRGMTPGDTESTCAPKKASTCCYDT